MCAAEVNLVRGDVESVASRAGSGLDFDVTGGAIRIKGPYVVAGRVALDDRHVHDLCREVLTPGQFQALALVLQSEQFAGMTELAVPSVLPRQDGAPA